MKKILMPLMLVLSLGLISCGGNKEYTPNVKGEYNLVYRSTTNKEIDGQYPIINISKIEKEGDRIIVSIAAPTIEQLDYSMTNFLYVQPMNIKGEIINFENIKLEPVQDANIEAKLNINGVKAEDVEWLEIGPYKVNDEEKLIFKVE